MRLGQHFLINSRIAEKIVDSANLSKRDAVLEIGPGRGVLTKILAKKAKKVIAIEKDKELAGELGGWDNVEVITGDALKVKFPKFNKIVSSLPFYISSPITFKFFEYKWDLAVLVYQKEFANRFITKPGEKHYSRLTVGINYYSKPEILGKISKGNFRPIPKVDSAIVRLKQRKPEFKTDEFFWELVKKLFQHKRKLVRTALKDARYPRIDYGKRVFECDLDDFRKIAEEVRKASKQSR